MPQRILVVDDEPNIRQLITLILEAEGYEVVQACNGLEAIEALDRHGCQLIILDIMMPEMDGWEVCRHIKSRIQTAKPPILILTVRNQPLDRVIGMEVVRANDYLTKPFDRKELLNCVEHLLGKKSGMSIAAKSMPVAHSDVI